MKKKLYYFLISFFLISCKKEEKVYFDDGKVKYLNTMDKGILNFKRFDREGNLMFVGRFSKSQLIDTLFIFDQEGFDHFVKIDSSDNNYFYGTFLSKYSTGAYAEVSLMRFNKGLDIDSVIGSSLLYGKKVIYKPDGSIGSERIYEIQGNSSKIVRETIYDSIK